MEQINGKLFLNSDILYFHLVIKGHNILSGTVARLY